MTRALAVEVGGGKDPQISCLSLDLEIKLLLPSDHRSMTEGRCGGGQRGGMEASSPLHHRWRWVAVGLAGGVA
jgi:hypothetical protein